MEKNPQKASGSAALALAMAVVSLFGTYTGHPFMGIFAALFCLPFAVFGLVFSVSPRVGGGMMSIGAVILGILACLLALLSMIGVILR